MELLTKVATLAELWKLGYKLRRIPKGTDVGQRQTLFAVVAPDGRELGYAHTDSEIFSVVNRHRQTTAGAA